MSEFKARYSFIKHNDRDNGFDTNKIIFHSEGTCLSEILEDLADFLRACGYIFPYGALEVSSDDTSTPSQEDTEEYE